MKPKEKAIELYEKFYYKLPIELMEKVLDCTAQECALIAVDEIIDKDGYNNEYWQEVKQEIKKL
jgi:hypothetical protein